jgi:hypothetical protein
VIVFAPSLRIEIHASHFAQFRVHMLPPERQDGKDDIWTVRL